METEQAETKRMLRELGDQAKRVARERSAYDGAWEEARRARVELLAAIVDAVRPALPALGSGLALRWSSHGVDAASAKAPFRAVLVGQMQKGPSLPCRFALASDSRRGRYGGTALYLTDEGVFVDLEYDGAWSDVPGEVSKWEAKWCPMTADDVVAEYDVADVLDRLTTALVQQAHGATPMRTANLLTRAKQLQALTKMLRGMR